MAAILFTEPNTPGYSLEPNFVQVQTDQVALAPGTIHLDITSTGPVLAEDIVIEWSGNTVTLTVEATTNSTATAIPTKDGGESLADYALRVFEALRQNDTITTDFHIYYTGAVGPAERITLTARVADVLDITVTNGLTNVAETVTDGSASAPDNLSAMLQVWKEETDPNSDARIVSLHATYEHSTALATFDLARVFSSLAPALPDTASIAPTVFATPPYGEAYGAFLKYYLRYADQYGTPVTAEALLKSDSYYMFYGGRQGDKLDTLIPAVSLRHAYNRADGGAFRKPITLDQPDWVYLWTEVFIDGCEIEVEVMWESGTATVETIPYTLFSLNPGKIHWLNAGPPQLRFDLLSAPAFPDKPWYYTWRLKGDMGDGTVTIKEVDYIIRPSADWDAFLLFDNGLGGCETALMRGKKTVSYQAARETARRLHWNDYTTAQADLFNFNAEGRVVYEMNTGWHDRYYIEHLRQLLLGQVWLVDIENERFLRLAADTESVEVYRDDNDLYSMKLTFTGAWIDRAVNIPANR